MYLLLLLVAFGLIIALTYYVGILERRINNIETNVSMIIDKFNEYISVTNELMKKVKQHVNNRKSF